MMLIKICVADFQNPTRKATKAATNTTTSPETPILLNRPNTQSYGSTVDNVDSVEDDEKAYTIDELLVYWLCKPLLAYDWSLTNTVSPLSFNALEIRMSEPITTRTVLPYPQGHVLPDGPMLHPGPFYP